MCVYALSEMQIASHEPLAVLPISLDLECEPYLQHRPAVVADLDCHGASGAVAMFPDRISRHVSKRASSLFLDRFDGREFQTFLVGRNAVTLSHVEIVPSHQTENEADRKLFAWRIRTPLRPLARERLRTKYENAIDIIAWTGMRAKCTRKKETRRKLQHLGGVLVSEPHHCASS
jgi:hypothetical protein